MKTITLRSLLLVGLAYCSVLNAQTKTTAKPVPATPKLIVGIVVDQMRYDYLYRFMDKFGEDGFKRLMKEGFNCRNTNYNYTPTETGPGHASIYTGTTPCIHGIVGNNWYDRVSGKGVYCSDDKSVKTVGAVSDAGQMSPKNMIASTITDEVHMASNMYSKVIGIALKDRGAILPAGHTANAAYWYDSSGAWISSTWYMKELPTWVQDFNKKELPKKYLSKSWNTLIPLDQYMDCYPDNNKYESKFKGESAPTFPHDLPGLMAANKNLDMIRYTPFGNSLTKDFAMAAIEEEHMGMGFATDFVTVSFSSTDYIGHFYGPRSIELEDTYLRLDKDIAELLHFLDKYIGKENVLIFLTADHAVVDVPQLLVDKKMPAGYFNYKMAIDSLKKHLNTTYGDTLVQAYYNKQIYLNHITIENKKLNEQSIEDDVADFMLRFDGVLQTLTANTMERTGFNADDARSFVQNGFQPKRCGDVMLIFQAAWIESDRRVGTTHGSSYSYDTHVPLLWYGWTVRPGSSVDVTRTIDIAPTVSMLLNIPFPDGCTGKPIPAVLNNAK
jgi:predicted AlkP superfamily pyrophosphatase or phosphodiesterase